MSRASLVRPALLLASTRVINMGVGLVVIPVLIHALGSEAFAAWAMLLTTAAVFAELETGMPLALIRHMAVPLLGDGRLEACRVFSTVAITVTAIYVILAPCVAWLALPLAGWLRLPSTHLLTPPKLLLVVFAAAGARAVLQLGTAALLSARAFSLAASFSLLQPLLSNLAAALAALIWRRLDFVLLAYWAFQLLVCSAAFGAAVTRLRLWPAATEPWDWGRCRALVSYGATVQVSSWAHTLTSHLNKLVIVRTLGLAPVAGYEVASRGALALRSIPGAGLETFLPTVTIDAARGSSSKPDVRALLTLSLYGALVFVGTPMAVAPVLLYGWIGELGFVSRWVFLGLGTAASVSLLVMPLATVAQALGRPAIQARAALLTVGLSLGLGLTLVGSRGLEGVAFGTAIAAVVGGLLLTAEVHRVAGLRLKDTLGAVLSQRWPPIVSCLAYGAGVHWAFNRWIEATPLIERYTVSARVTGLLICGCLYLLCLAAMIGAQGLLKGFDEGERALLARVRARLPWAARAAREA